MTLNLGAKIDNQDINDSYYFQYLKVNEFLRHVFEGKLSSEAIAIIKKDIENMKITNCKLSASNRYGIIDFDQLMLCTISKRRELILDYPTETLKAFYLMMMK